MCAWKEGGVLVKGDSGDVVWECQKVLDNVTTHMNTLNESYCNK